MKNRMIFLTLIVTLVFPLLAFANSAEPPALIIVVTDPHKEVQVAVLSSKGDIIQPQISQVAWERHFKFYKLSLEPHKAQRILVKTPDKSFEVITPHTIRDYHSVFTLDPLAQTLTEGTSPYRDGLLVGVRLLLTLLIEGAIFYAFGFRQRLSWIVFIGVNLLTQGFLNIWLSYADNWDSYLEFLLIYGEFFVFMIESILMTILLKEKTISKRLTYVWFSNFVSLVLGGYLIINLPL